QAACPFLATSSPARRHRFLVLLFPSLPVPATTAVRSRDRASVFPARRAGIDLSPDDRSTSSGLHQARRFGPSSRTPDQAVRTFRDWETADMPSKADRRRAASNRVRAASVAASRPSNRRRLCESVGRRKPPEPDRPTVHSTPDLLLSRATLGLREYQTQDRLPYWGRCRF